MIVCLYFFHFMCKVTNVELCLEYITNNYKGNGVDENFDMGYGSLPG